MSAVFTAYSEMSKEVLLEQTLRLHEENARLRAALKPFVEPLEGDKFLQDKQVIECFTRNEVMRIDLTVGDFRAARKALGETS